MDRMTHVTILTGSAGTGKSERLLDEYRASLDRAKTERRPGSTLWLVPNRRIQKITVRDVVGRCAGTCFAPNVLTFDLFAEKILEAAGRPASPISPVMKRLLLRRIAESLHRKGELQHFRPIAHTTGFLDVVSSFISELKREEIWPDRFIDACRERKSAFAQRDKELGLFYERYQDHLTEQNWYDNEGRFWLARNKLEEGIRGPFANVRFLVVDGFVDFTQTQYEILGHLARWIDQIMIALPLEHPLTRPELFLKPQAAIGRIRKQLPPGTEYQLVRLQAEASTNSLFDRQEWPKSIRVIADRLFSNPRDCPVSKNAEGLEIIRATGQSGEWQAVARRIKNLLTGGPDGTRTQPEETSGSHSVRPQDIVIAMRSISDDGPRLRDDLVSAGIPAWCEAELPLASSPIVKSVLLLLQLELEDWPFDRLTSVLDSSYFQPAWAEWKSGLATRAVAASLRRLRVHSGREAILAALKRSAKEVAATAAAVGDSLAETVTLALPLVVRLDRCLERLRRTHTLADWADVLSSIVEDLGWTRQTAKSVDAAATNELRDLDLLQRILRTAAEADQNLAGDRPPQKMDLAAFTSELRDLLSHETTQSPIEPGGCIRVLSVEQVRNLDVPHLFMVGLTEDSFPRSRSDDCLFSESERQEFNSKGIALGHRSRQHAEEMLLFYSVVTRARRSLTLSYPEVNSKGQQVFPSPYLTALRLLFDRDSLADSPEGQLDPVPAADRALTLTELRLAAMDEARRGRPGLFRAVLDVDLEPVRLASWNTLAACNVADHRFHQRDFTAYEGRLELPQNLDWLRHRFGSHHQFSATELESYARCPFQFWLSNVLKIGPVESPEEETDHAFRGNLLHDVLAKLLTEGAMADPDLLRTRFLQLVEDQLGRSVPQTALRKALVTIEQSILAEWADAFVNQQAAYTDSLVEILDRTHSLSPEIPFGSLPHAPESESAFPSIKFGDGENSVQLRGRIDRVDVGSFEGRPAYVVVDYKTGRPPSSTPEDLISGRSIQLALYLVAVKRLGMAGQDAIPFQMGYWALRETGFKTGRGKMKPIDGSKIEHWESVLDQLLPELAEQIRSGRFIVENEDQNCTGRCAYRTVCRVNQLRPLADRLGKRSPPRSSPVEFSTGTHDATRSVSEGKD